MTLMSRIVGRLASLPPAHTHAVTVERDLRVPMPDGVVLLADRFVARGGERQPIVLVRSPYGRRAIGVYGQVFAERGYQAVIQSTRGTFGSGGEFDALRNEEADGRATLDWLATQPWFNGSVAMTGPSYVGFVQWAVATDGPEFLKALAPQITASQFRTLNYPGESFALDSILSWVYLLRHQEESLWQVQLAGRREKRVLAPIFASLPLAKTDQMATGRPVKFYQDWLAHNQPGDPFWDAVDHSKRMEAVSAPINLLGGWYDIFLPQQLADYQALRQVGKQPYLTIGPWMHRNFAVLMTGIRESLSWFDAHLRDDRSHLRQQPVRIFVMGEERWRDLADWPPPATSTRWHLQSNGGLAPIAPSSAADPDRYTYDPTDPTPSVGGIVLGTHAGPRDNRQLEARPDVLVYTSAPLEDDLEVIGPVSAELYVRTSLKHTDFFARLCVVEPSGKSVNLCDGILRLTPESDAPESNGSRHIKIALWPTAYHFRKGQRLRVQISSGAHPRFARNPGSGEPVATATKLFVADQAVYHDPDHPSAILLPVLEG